MTELTLLAKEQSNYQIDVAFESVSGAAITPDTDTVTWTLTTPDGTVINSRTAVAETSASTVTVELEGDDLAILEGETDAYVKRILTVYAEKDGTPIRNQAQFTLENLVAVT